MSHDNLPILSRDQNSAISLRRADQLLKITDKILANSRHELATLAESWIERLWAWADENRVSDLEWRDGTYVGDTGWFGLPRKRQTLLELKTLSFYEEEKIETLPPEIGKLRQLKELNVFSNNLTSLPPEIAQLNQLKALDVGGNNLSTLPPEIFNLRQLEELDIGFNKFRTLPPEIGQLRQLKKLYVEENEFSSLPPEIFQLRYLKKLYIGGSNLSTLPPEIGQLRQLEELSLQINDLNPLPSEIGQLKQLKKLIIDDDFLHYLPSTLLLNNDLKIFRFSSSSIETSMETRRRAAKK